MLHTCMCYRAHRFSALREKVASSDTTSIRWRTLADDVERRKENSSIEDMGISVTYVTETKMNIPSLLLL